MDRNEAKLISASIAFANWRDLGSTDRVEAHFRKASSSPQWQAIPPDQLSAYQADQSELRGWLLGAMSYDKATKISRESLANRVINELRGVVHGVGRVEFAGGRLTVTWGTILPGVRSCTAYTAALLLDDTRNLRFRLGHCAYEECDRFFFDTRPRPGKGRRYCEICTKKHASSDRQRRYRLLQKIGG